MSVTFSLSLSLSVTVTVTVQLAGEWARRVGAWIQVSGLFMNDLLMIS